jgi:YegS/Rv2252/BmrU family lipid kinase
MKRKLLFFINPISGSGKNKKLIQVIQDVMEKQHMLYEIMDTLKNGDYSFLPGKIETEGITDVIICGGDGTINQVASHLKNISVNTGIIPLGSGNGLALAAGISKNPVKALQIILAGKSAPLDAMMINHRFSCMLCGLGFDAQVAHDFAKQPTRGLTTYIKQTVRNFFSSKSYPFSIETNGRRLETEAFFISIANSNQFGNHVTIAPLASLNDGLLDVVVVKKNNKLAMVYSLLRQIRMGKLHEPLDPSFSNKTIHYFQASNLRIHNLCLAPLHIDGEAVHTEEVMDIQVLPNALRLLQP